MLTRFIQPLQLPTSVCLLAAVAASAVMAEAPVRGTSLRSRRNGAAMICRVVLACALALDVISPVLAGDCVRDNYGTVYCGRGDCAMDSGGRLRCAKPGGRLIRDQYGDLLCGAGYCAAEDTGRLLCSPRPGGNVSRDSYGKVTCAGGCVDAQAQLCEDLR